MTCSQPYKQIKVTKFTTMLKDDFYYFIIGDFAVICNKNEDQLTVISQKNLCSPNIRDIVLYSDIPMFLLDKNKALNLIKSESKLYVEKNIKDEILDILDDFHGSSYDDFLISINKEYTLQIQEYLQKLLKISQLSGKSIRIYNPFLVLLLDEFNRSYKLN